MKRPLLLVASLFIAGILGAEKIHLPLPFLFGASLAAAMVALAWERGRGWLLGLLIVLTGWTDASWQNAPLAPGDLRVTQGENVSEAGLRGRIEAPPAQRVFELGGRELWHSSALIEVSEIGRQDQWQEMSGNVIATMRGELSSNFFAGQRVEVHGVLRRPSGPVAEGLFDARGYYQRAGVFYQLQTGGTNDWAVAPGGAGEMPVSERFRRWATRTLELGFPAEDEALKLTRTLVLDWKAPLSDTVEEPFMRAGTYHIFAVDGLRIGLLALIGVGFLRGLRISRAICGVMLVPALWFYVGLTGWPASAIRAAIMASVVILGWVCRRPGDTLNSLCAAAFIILLWEPNQLFQPGFQLSFLVVACIALFVPWARPFLQWVRDKMFKHDSMLPYILQSRMPPPFLYVAVLGLDVIILSIAAWLGSIPLAAYYFHLFTPMSVPANCVVVPLTALALMSAMGSLVTGGWFPGLAILFNNATWALMKFIICFSEMAAKRYYNAAAPSLAVCVLYYAAFFLIASGWIFRSRHKWVVCAGLLAAGTACLIHWEVERRIVRLSILPLRDAASVFVDAPGRAGSLLLDCGSSEEAGEIVKPFLCAQGVNHLDAFYLGVGLRPYFDGARVILTNFCPRRIFTGAAPVRSAAYHELVGTLRQTGRWQAEQDGGKIAGWSVLHPAATQRLAQADDNALVLRGEFNGHSVALLPALGRDGQEALMRRHPELRAEMVLAGLPAREEPLCDPLLDMLQPRLIVIMDTALPATRRASASLRARLARRAARVVYGRDNGALTLELGPQTWDLRNASGEEVPDTPQPEPAEE